MITVLLCVHSRTELNDKFLSDAILSLRSQTYKDFKTIIVLDQCWDGTKKMLESIRFDTDTFLVLERDKKEGLSFAKNYGLSFVDTEYVAFLDADDMYEPTKLEKQVEFLKTNDVDFLGTHAWNIHVNDRYKKVPAFDINSYNTHEEITNRFPQENILTHGSVMVKMKTLNELGGYRNIEHEDYDLWKRAANAGYKFYQLPERLYILGGGSSVPRGPI